jgi:hypothetical protein
MYSFPFLVITLTIEDLVSTFSRSLISKWLNEPEGSNLGSLKKNQIGAV